MAPMPERDDRGIINGDEIEEDDEQNLWANLLSEVQSSSSTKLPSSKSLLVLGDNESGKTTLIAKLQGTEDPRKGAGLEYHYINVKDEYRDDQTRLGVWILDGDPHHTGLLKFALSEESFAHTLALVVVSMAQPWSIMEALQKWTTVLQDHVERLRISRDQREEYEQSLVRHFQEYVEPEEGQTSSSSAARRGGPNPLHPTASNTDEEKVLLPLGETTLTNNLGIPLVVVVTKTDAISTLEKEHDYKEEHFDFIQQHIRKFCLNYGAALFYSSVKEEKNCDLLYRYCIHRIYGFPFNTPAYVVERDSVFVPSGWDNEKKISILYENMTSMKPEDSFEDIIVKPITRKPIQRDAEIQAEDDQVFLMKQQTLLSKAPPAGGRQDSPLRPSGSVQKPTTSPRVSASPTAAGGMVNSPKKPTGHVKRENTVDNQKLDGSKQNQTSEGVLANFFNSLLSKKSTGGGPPGAPGTPAARPSERAAMTRDAAAELDRLNRTKKPVPGTTPNSSAS